jgi:hypothetical protein
MDFSGLLSAAGDFFTQLFPAFVPVLGIQFGIGILLMVIGITGALIFKLARTRV